MRISRFIVQAALALGLVVSTQACGSSDAATSEGRLCTPGAFVFCRCADQASGTKLCNDDGKTFEACSSTGQTGVCQGGEIQDPDTGKPVDEQGKVIPPGEPPPVTNDLETCPGKPTAVPPGADVVVTGAATGARDDLKGKAGACVTGSGGPDHVYRLQPTWSGLLQVKVQGEGALNPTVYLRSTCPAERIVWIWPIGWSTPSEASVS